jgi:hypothetical protein
MRAWHKLLKTGPLIIVILSAVVGIYYILCRPLYYISLHSKWKHREQSVIPAVICGIIAGLPLTILLAFNWLKLGVGGSFAGFSIVIFNGIPLGLVVFCAILDAEETYHKNDCNKIFKKPARL